MSAFAPDAVRLARQTMDEIAPELSEKFELGRPFKYGFGFTPDEAGQTGTRLRTLAK